MTLARLVLPALRWRPETGFSHETDAIAQALKLGVGGFIIFGVPGARADEIGALTAELRVRAGRPLLLGADLERGAGQQARRLTPIPPPAALASSTIRGDRVGRRHHRARGAERRAQLGLRPGRGPRPRAREVRLSRPGRSAAIPGAGEAVATWVRAAQAEGVLACAKHYPGHGRTRHDSHNRLPLVELPLAALEQADLRPFQAAVAAGVGSVMTCHVAFPQWDESDAPATLSPVILGHLRSALGFRGLVVTDALIMEGAQGGRAPGAAEVAAPRRAVTCCSTRRSRPPWWRRSGRRWPRTTPAQRVSEAASAATRLPSRVGSLDAVTPDPEAGGAARRRAAAAGHARLPPRHGALVPDGVELTVVDDDLGAGTPPVRATWCAAPWRGPASTSAMAPRGWCWPSREPRAAKDARGSGRRRVGARAPGARRRAGGALRPVRGSRRRSGEAPLPRWRGIASRSCRRRWPADRGRMT